MKIPLRALRILLAFASAAAADPPQKPLENTPELPSVPRPAPQILTADLKAAAQLAQAGQLMDADHLAAGLKLPTRGKVALSAPSQVRLSGREIAERARAGYVRVGWYYHCVECGNWHINTSGGYAISADTIVTACHVLEPPPKMRNTEGFPIAVRGESEVLPILAVLAADKDTDAVVLRVGVSNLVPLALADDARVGDTVFCLSDPHGIRGYFSNGIINRLYSMRPSAGIDARFQRLNVSTDWAPGSSGAAVLDERGNVVGQVARISSIFNDLSAPPDHLGARSAVLMTLHEAVPAKSVLALLRR